MELVTSRPGSGIERGTGARSNGSLRFAVVGDISQAVRFVAANWPDQRTRPLLDSQATPPTLHVRLDAETIRTLQETLGEAMVVAGPLQQSARSFRLLLAARLAGRVIPRLPESTPH